MTPDQHIANISSLPVEDQLSIVRAIWERLPACTSADDAAKIGEELDRRMEKYKKDPTAAKSLSEFRNMRETRSLNVC